MAVIRRGRRGDTTVIQLDAIQKRYGKTVAVHDVSLLAPNGLVTGLLGPNGAGKTTALRVITGLIRPDTGRAMVDGLDVSAQPGAIRARLGVVPESAGTYDRLSVREHIAYSGALHGLGRAAIHRRVGELLDQLGLTALASRQAGALSLGERRRLTLARALVHEPANLLLDEPTNGLDVMSARAVRQEIRRLAAAGCAVLVSSHVMPEVAAMCDRVVVLANGVVAATGTPAELIGQTGCATLEEAFVHIIGSDEGLN
jgi:sodium transport system ATP-binding protein